MNSLSIEQLAALRRLDSCSVANAVETFHHRLRNEGFTDASVHCMFPELGPIVGYAVTLTLRSSSPPTGGATYLDRTDWWDYVVDSPQPRILVIQDVDGEVGRGALIGEVHAHILRALGCVGALTNGAVRDLGAVGRMKFPLFAGCVAVSHAYAHVISVGAPVRLGGLEIQSGDLLHADRHGVVSVPAALATQVPEVAAQLRQRERELIAICNLPGITPQELREKLQQMPLSASPSK
jgi:regulator of RNase E activity RraA